MSEQLKYLKVLGISEETVNEEDIKRHYYALVKKLHPDINPAGTEQLKDVNLAKEWLDKNFNKKPSPVEVDKRHTYWRILKKEDVDRYYNVEIPFNIKHDCVIWFMLGMKEFRIPVSKDTRLPVMIQVDRKDITPQPILIRISNEYKFF